MNEIINALIGNEMAEDRSEAIDIIESMKEELASGESIEDVLYQYDLDLDYAIDLFDTIA